MFSWSDQVRDPAYQTTIGAQRSPPDEPEDGGDAAAYDDDAPANDESRRIVEEAIRRIEEAEHEWNHSWEPDKPADQ